MLTLLVPLSVGACFRAHRPAPVEPGAVWSTHLGEPTRSPFEGERISESQPQELWRAGIGRGLPDTPVPSGPVLLVGTTNRMIIALSGESGESYWEHRKHGPFAVSPVVDGQTIYAVTADVDARAYALRLRDGRERWERKISGSSVPLEADGERLYVATEGGQLVALRLRDGERLWGAPVGPAAAAPLKVGDRILVGSDRDTLYAVDVDRGRIAQRAALPAAISSAPAAVDGLVLVPLRSGELVALDAASLAVRWRVALGGPILAAPVATSRGPVYLLDRTGSVWAVDSRGEARRLAALGSAATGSLAVVANAVLVGLLDGRLVALDPESGARMWEVALGASIHSPAFVRDGQIFVPLRSGRLVKLR